MMEGDYEIRTDLPSARARHLESDERDLSPAMITTARLILENWMRKSLRTYATPSLIVFFWIVWSQVLAMGILVHPKLPALHHPISAGCSALPSI